MSIQLHIERLVLDAEVLGGSRPAAVRLAIERELARQLGAPGAVAALRGIGAVARWPAVPLAPASAPRDGLGERIAHAVGHGLGIPPTARPAGRR